MATSALEQQLIAKLSKARSTSVDGLEVREHNLSDIIRALEYCKQQETANDRTKTSFRYNQFRSPGAV